MHEGNLRAPLTFHAKASLFSLWCGTWQTTVGILTHATWKCGELMPHGIFCDQWRIQVDGYTLPAFSHHVTALRCVSHGPLTCLVESSHSVREPLTAHYRYVSFSCSPLWGNQAKTPPLLFFPDSKIFFLL